jgi:mevalonate kinase
MALGIGMGSDASVLVQLLDALRLAYQRFAFALSLPW